MKEYEPQMIPSPVTPRTLPKTDGCRKAAYGPVSTSLTGPPSTWVPGDPPPAKNRYPYTYQTQIPEMSRAQTKTTNC